MFFNSFAAPPIPSHCLEPGSVREAPENTTFVECYLTKHTAAIILKNLFF